MPTSCQICGGAIPDGTQRAVHTALCAGVVVEQRDEAMWAICDLASARLANLKVGDEHVIHDLKEIVRLTFARITGNPVHGRPHRRAKCQKEKVMKRCERAIITKCPNVALSDEPGATCTAHASQEPDVKTEARSLLEWLSGWGDGPNWSDTSGATVPIVKESLRRVLTYVMSEGIPGCAHCDGSGRCTHCDIVSRAT
jgi:hypothetical protein